MLKAAKRSDLSQRVLNKIISIFLIRNFGDQKAMGQYIQSAKRKKP